MSNIWQKEEETKGEYDGGDPGEASGMKPKWQHGMGGAHGCGS